MQVFTTKELVEAHFPYRAPLVGGPEAKVIPAKGLITLAAPEKLGKSQLAMQIALSRATARPWLHFGVTPGNTLYINAEIAVEELQERVKDMLAVCGEPTAGDVIWVTVRGGMGWQLNELDGDHHLKQLITKHEPDLIVLDPLTDLFSGDESDQVAIKNLLRKLRNLPGTPAVLIVHHFRKAPRDPRNRRQGPQEMSGSGILTRSPDSLLWMEVAEGADIEDGRAWLKFRLRNSKSPSAIYLERKEHQWWRPGVYVPPEKKKPGPKSKYGVRDRK